MRRWAAVINKEEDKLELNIRVVLVKSLVGPPLDESINRK